MNGAKLLKIVLVIVGLLFVALAYPMVLYVREEPALAMMLSLYVTLGVFLLLAARNPSAHRSLIAFTAWSSFVHAALMAFQVSQHMIQSRELIGTGVLFAIGVVLLALSPPRPTVEPASSSIA